MDDEEIDAVDLELDDFGVGKARKTLGPGSVAERKNTGAAGRQGTIYG